MYEFLIALVTSDLFLLELNFLLSGDFDGAEENTNGEVKAFNTCDYLRCAVARGTRLNCVKITTKVWQVPTP